MASRELRTGDAFGSALFASLDGAEAAIVIERDDGFVDVDGSDYFRNVTDDPLWPWLRPRITGRVLDVGAGAGRAAIQLQGEGLEVVALDVSPGCVDVCDRRGVEHTYQGIIEEPALTQPASFDSVVAIGNNLGLLGSPETAGSFLDAARAIGSNDVRIVGTMLDPYLTDEPLHLSYHERNRLEGRLGGEARICVRYQNIATDWFTLLWASKAELAEICAAHGWSVVATEQAGILYAAELRPT